MVELPERQPCDLFLFLFFVCSYLVSAEMQWQFLFSIVIGYSILLLFLSVQVKSSRAFFNEVNKRFPTLPFSLRSLPDEKVRTNILSFLILFEDASFHNKMLSGYVFLYLIIATFSFIFLFSFLFFFCFRQQRWEWRSASTIISFSNTQVTHQAELKTRIL